MLISQRHTIAEAKDSVDRLYALVEKYFKNMSSRVQALESLSMQKKDHESLLAQESWQLENDTESLTTIHAPVSNLATIHVPASNPRSINAIDSFDFTDELQRSRVYRRNQAFSQSCISVLTKSAYSLGWSFFSSLSMAEVSHISVINLAITEREVFNPERLSQTWVARPIQESSASHRIDGQRTQLPKVVNKDTSAVTTLKDSPALPVSIQIQQRGLAQAHSASSQSSPIKNPDHPHHPKKRFTENENAKEAENLDGTPVLRLVGPSEPQSSPQDQAHSSGSPEQDEAEYPCQGCGEVCSMLFS